MANPVAAAIGVAGSIFGGLFGDRGARDAADTQAAAADRALAVFEKNAGLSQTILEDQTERANKTLREGADRSEGLIRQGANVAADNIRSSSQRARDELVLAYNLEEEAINSSAIAASGFINAARENAANFINESFGEASGNIKTGRDLVNSILQSSANSAEQKLDFARAGAIAAQERGLSAIRSDFQPFIDAGQLSIENASALANDPEAQKQFILDNPFFDEIAQQAESRLTAGRAATGKFESGGTSLELRNQLLAVGNQLLDSSITQRLNIANLGVSAASQVANAEQNTANSISGIEQNIGMSLSDLVERSGVNQANNEQSAARDLANLVTKRGGDLAANAQGAGNQLAQIEQDRGGSIANAVDRGAQQFVQAGLNEGSNIANIASRGAADLANLNTNTTTQIAGNEANLGVNKSNILNRQAANAADTLIGRGDAEAAGIVGSTDAVTGALSDLNKIILPQVFAPKKESDADKIANQNY